MADQFFPTFAAVAALEDLARICAKIYCPLGGYGHGLGQYSAISPFGQALALGVP